MTPSWQAETYQNAPNRPTHGYNGPLKVSYGGAMTNVGRDYMEMMEKYETTREIVDDANRMVDDVNRVEVRGSCNADETRRSLY